PGETNYYIYCGFLAVPLAVAGLRDRRVRVAGLTLIVFSLWYMLGPDAGLYRVAGMALPLLHKVRAPIHLWFVTAFGLAVLGAAGALAISGRWPASPVRLILALIVFADLFYWNSLVNTNAYARHSFADLYGNKEAVAESQ